MTARTGISSADAPPSKGRRHLLGGLATLAAGYAGLRYGLPWASARLGGDGFDFTDLPAVPGFRSLPSGAMTAGFDAFFDAGATAPAVPPEVTARVAADPCAALHRAGSWTEGAALPIASFSDYNCPYCRSLTKRLVARTTQHPSPPLNAGSGAVSVTWHELPRLGPTSRIAARAALAAAMQGAYIPFHMRLMRAPFQLTPAYVGVLADDMGLDGDRLVADMDSARVTEKIAVAEALARLFGILGTPALVVGRTLVLGEIPAPRLTRLIARERADGPPGVCT